MLWPLIFPTLITFYLFLAIIVLLVIIAPRLKWKRGETLVFCLLLGTLLFIPSCLGIKFIVDQYRFGWASYPDFASIKDFRVERYLPPQATQITIFRHYHGNGYFGRFKISQANLTTWHDAKWTTASANPDWPRKTNDMHEPISREKFDRRFGKGNWKDPGDLVEFDGPRAPNAAGYFIYYSPSQQLAYIRGGYW